MFSKSGHRKIIASCWVGREIFCPRAKWALKNFPVKCHFPPPPPLFINNHWSLIVINLNEIPVVSCTNFPYLSSWSCLSRRGERLFLIIGSGDTSTFDLLSGLVFRLSVGSVGFIVIFEKPLTLTTFTVFMRFGSEMLLEFLSRWQLLFIPFLKHILLVEDTLLPEKLLLSDNPLSPSMQPTVAIFPSHHDDVTRNGVRDAQTKGFPKGFPRIGASCWNYLQFSRFL